MLMYAQEFIITQCYVWHTEIIRTKSPVRTIVLPTRSITVNTWVSMHINRAPCLEFGRRSAHAYRTSKCGALGTYKSGPLGKRGGQTGQNGRLQWKPAVELVWNGSLQWNQSANRVITLQTGAGAGAVVGEGREGRKRRVRTHAVEMDGLSRPPQQSDSQLYVYSRAPLVEKPNCLHTTRASLCSHLSSHTVPHSSWWQNSTRPLLLLWPPTKRTSPSLHPLHPVGEKYDECCRQALVAKASFNADKMHSSIAKICIYPAGEGRQQLAVHRIQTPFPSGSQHLEQETLFFNVTVIGDCTSFTCARSKITEVVCALYQRCVRVSRIKALIYRKVLSQQFFVFEQAIDTRFQISPRFIRWALMVFGTAIFTFFYIFGFTVVPAPDLHVHRMKYGP